MKDGNSLSCNSKRFESTHSSAANSPLPVQTTKDALNFCAGKSVDDGLKYVVSISGNIIPSEDLMEAMQAFQEKRKPVFSGR